MFDKNIKVDSSLKHVGQNVGHQRYLEENYGKRMRVSSKDRKEEENNAVWDGCCNVSYKWKDWIGNLGVGWNIEQLFLLKTAKNKRKVNKLFISSGVGVQG